MISVPVMEKDGKYMSNISGSGIKDGRNMVELKE